jgi:glycosyltransferase involved in cell wall biosynthesis
MNVLSFMMGSANGGVPCFIAEAFKDETDWNVHSLVSQQNYIGYPRDLEWTRQNIAEYWAKADVVHIHHNYHAVDRLMRQRIVGGRHKPYVLEFHGSSFRDDPNRHLREFHRRGKVALVSTLDLYLLAPNVVEWLPQLQNVERLSKMRKPHKGQKVRIAHAPTNRQIKSTDLFIEAVDRLKAEGYPVEYDIIERVPWTECLRRKAKADIYFDQVILGYGCNALEAWGMGIPVVAGASDETLDEMERRFGHLPFYHATPETIYDALKELVEDPELRARYGQIGHDYVRKYHDEPVVVEQLKRIYRRAAGVEMEEAA